MISADDVRRVARPWSLALSPASRGEVELFEFESGYVVSPPRVADGRPRVRGRARAVVDKATGELTEWPSLDAEDVAERYQRVRDHEGRGRFPTDVLDVLVGAGWRPGRDVSAAVDGWLREVHAEHPDARERMPMFPAARAALAEFGGLRLVQERRVGYVGGGYRIETWPDAGRVIVDLYAGYAADFGLPVFPFAWYEDGSSELVVDADGRVYLLHMAGDFLIGDTVDAGLVALIRGPELREVDERGHLIEYNQSSSI